MDYIPDFVLDVYNNTLLAGLLYWLPLAFCAVGYIARTARNFAIDRRQRAAPGVYPDAPGLSAPAAGGE